MRQGQRRKLCLRRDPVIWRLQVHESLTSTSDICVAAAKNGEPDGLAVLARTQTAGRGTHGRGWVAPQGNLYLSFLVRPDMPVARLGEWGLMAAVSLVDALLPHVPQGLSLKWPNDVLRDGAKLSGILCEASTRPDHTLDWLVIGVGVNLRHAPEVPGRRTACVGPDAPVPEAFARGYLDCFSARQRVLEQDGFAPIRDAWLKQAHPQGTELRITSGGAQVSGRFHGLSARGTLLLDMDGTIKEFASGEIL